MGYLAFFSICLFVAFFSLGVGPINWVITSEVFPNKVISIICDKSLTFLTDPWPSNQFGIICQSYCVWIR